VLQRMLAKAKGCVPQLASSCACFASPPCFPVNRRTSRLARAARTKKFTKTDEAEVLSDLRFVTSIPLMHASLR